MKTNLVEGFDYKVSNFGVMFLRRETFKSLTLYRSPLEKNPWVASADLYFHDWCARHVELFFARHKRLKTALESLGMVIVMVYLSFLAGALALGFW